MSLDDSLYAEPSASQPGVLAGRFDTDTSFVIVRDYDGGQHQFGPVIRTPSTGTPVAGDWAWLIETRDGQYIVVTWTPA